MTTDDVSGDLPELLSVATLGKLHGVKGELKLRCTPERVEFLREIAEDAVPVTLRLPESGDEYEVTFTHVRGHESAPIVAIDGIDGREAAEEYRGADVLVARDALPPLDEDEYFLGDLEGCIVHDTATGERIGAVTRADSLPANVVLTVRLDAGGDLLAPLVTDAVPTVDVAARRIDLHVAFLGLDDVDEEPGS
jgi:16S rRNA processing protein RimM